MKILPIGFKRDYAVGMTSHEYIFHMDVDTYLDQSKNLLDVYIRNNDYKGAFILLLQIISVELIFSASAS